MNKEEQKAQYNADYQRDNIRQFKLNFNKKTDAELVEWLETKKPLAPFVRDILLQVMQAEKGQQ